MRVAVDLSHTRLSSAGTTRYARELVTALHRREDVEVITVGDGEPIPRGGGRRYRTVLAMDLTWYPYRGSRVARKAKADVYHLPLPRGPLRRSALPTVVTLHDLVPLQYPRTMGGWNRLYTRATLRRVANVADLIVVPSNDSANDVIRWLPLSQERVRVVHHGVSQQFFSAVVPGALRGERERHDAYVLFVGTPEPRKNLSRLVEAMRMLRAQHRQERLVIAGGEGWGDGMPPADPAIMFLGRVSDERLHQLYTGARCVVLPSLHEGFGLPAVEAMAVGAPVVVSRVGALPEVCGDAAIYVDPLDARSIAQGILEAMESAETLCARGHLRARSFTWERAAEQLAGVYRELL